MPRARPGLSVPSVSSDPRARVSITVNGELVEREVSVRMLLSDFLRHELRLTGTHVGCEHGVCGACTVLIDGKAGAFLPDACRPGLRSRCAHHRVAGRG